MPNSKENTIYRVISAKERFGPALVAVTVPAPWLNRQSSSLISPEIYDTKNTLNMYAES